MKRLSLLFAFIFLFATGIQAKEGMWLPWLLSQNEAEMQEMGLKLTAQDIFDINNGSLKDAIISFGGFCTGEVISGKGLILTNHHCGYGQIQSHSSVENDLLKNGFWAKDASGELKNPGLKAIFVKYVKDVTNEVLEGTQELSDEKMRQALISQNIQKVIDAEENNNGYEIEVKPFYKGNQYYLMAKQVYNDVRLVGAPPSSIGKYGADTDNWMWPRHTGDFALFRIYADADGNPAQPSEGNQPLNTPNFLKISLKGVQPGDFTMVYGFPGRTDQYLPAVAVRQTLEIRNPARIKIRETLLSQLDARMRQSDEVRIKYAAKYARISNAWKKWIGENQGLAQTNALKKKADYERSFKNTLVGNPEWHGRWGTVLHQLESAYAEFQPYALAYDYFVEIAFRGIEILPYAYSFSALEKETDSEKLESIAQRLLSRQEGFFKDYDQASDRDAMAALFDLYYHSLKSDLRPEVLEVLYKKYKGNFRKMAKEYFENTLFLDVKKREKLLVQMEKKPGKVADMLKKDPMYQLANQMFEFFYNDVRPEYVRIMDQIEPLEREYMLAQMTVFPGRDFYPDANSTMRLTYGKVEGFEPRDAVAYHHVSYTDGIMEKYVPGDYEFDLPQRLIDLHEKKEFGPYGEDGKMPVCFIASNHTSGGNSGSPALNGEGHLIGLNFDRAWEGTMSDINYDILRCRNIMVDVRYILFIVDKFAGASYLVDEMELVGR